MPFFTFSFPPCKATPCPPCKATPCPPKGEGGQGVALQGGQGDKKAKARSFFTLFAFPLKKASLFFKSVPPHLKVRGVAFSLSPFPLSPFPLRGTGGCFARGTGGRGKGGQQIKQKQGVLRPPLGEKARGTAFFDFFLVPLLLFPPCKATPSPKGGFCLSF